MKQLAKSIMVSVAQIGAKPDDDIDLRLKKSLLVLTSVLIIIPALAWGLIYYLLGATLAGAIPVSYAFVSALSIAFLA